MYLERAETYLNAQVQDEEWLLTLATALRTYERSGSVEEAFVELLPEVLRLSQSEFGFLAEVRRDSRGQPYLFSHAVTDIFRDDFRRYHVVSGLSFYNLDTLNGAMLTSARPVLSDDPSSDPRSGGLPPGHASMDSFLGMPFVLDDELVGACAVANRPSGYGAEERALFEHLVAVGGCIIAASRC